MSERDDNPKPLPDDFGMTMPGIRPNKQPPQNPENLDMTVPNLRLPNQSQPQTPPSAPPEDFGMTMPGIPRSGAPRSLPPDDFDLTSPNIRREPPSDVDFSATMPGVGYSSGSRNEPDFGATMPYISLPENERRQYRETIAPPVPTKREEKRGAGGIPLWLWITSGTLGALALLLIAGVALWFVFWRDTGFVLVVKQAPAGSSVFVDNIRCGEPSGDAIKCFGLEADKPRTVRVTHEGYTEHTETIRNAKNGEDYEIRVEMSLKNAAPPPAQQNNCDDPDPRVAQAECRALDELDKLTPPFTVDDLVRVLNLQIINFESNKFDIPDKRKTFLRKAAQKFNQLQGSPVVEIGGHTDNQGGADANLILSQNRANAVRNFLSGAGVSESMLTIKSYGANKPKTENNTDDGRFQNRRIEYTVVKR